MVMPAVSREHLAAGAGRVKSLIMASKGMHRNWKVLGSAGAAEALAGAAARGEEAAAR
jgi:hypothetical protein